MCLLKRGGARDYNFLTINYMPWVPYKQPDEMVVRLTDDKVALDRGGLEEHVLLRERGRSRTGEVQRRGLQHCHGHAEHGALLHARAVERVYTAHTHLNITIIIMTFHFLEHLTGIIVVLQRKRKC
jgi:hypothetical protein